jgi:phosphotransferase system HPr (HPr) family protein
MLFLGLKLFSQNKCSNGHFKINSCKEWNALIEKEVTVTIKEGLHAKPAGELVQNLSRFTSDVEFQFKNRSYNAKSILGLMGAGIREGQIITVKVDGPDEEEALEWLETFI